MGEASLQTPVNRYRPKRSSLGRSEFTDTVVPLSMGEGPTRSTMIDSRTPIDLEALNQALQFDDISSHKWSRKSNDPLASPFRSHRSLDLKIREEEVYSKTASKPREPASSHSRAEKGAQRPSSRAKSKSHRASTVTAAKSSTPLALPREPEYDSAFLAATELGPGDSVSVMGYQKPAASSGRPAPPTEYLHPSSAVDLQRKSRSEKEQEALERRAHQRAEDVSKELYASLHSDASTHQPLASSRKPSEAGRRSSRKTGSAVTRRHSQAPEPSSHDHKSRQASARPQSGDPGRPDFGSKSKLESQVIATTSETANSLETHLRGVPTAASRGPSVIPPRVPVSVGRTKSQTSHEKTRSKLGLLDKVANTEQVKISALAASAVYREASVSSGRSSDTACSAVSDASWCVVDNKAPEPNSKDLPPTPLSKESSRPRDSTGNPSSSQVADQRPRESALSVKEEELIELLRATAQSNRRLARKKEEAREAEEEKLRKNEARVAAHELLCTKNVNDAVEKSKSEMEREVKEERRKAREIKEEFKSEVKSAKKEADLLKEQNHVLNMRILALKEREKLLKCEYEKVEMYNKGVNDGRTRGWTEFQQNLDLIFDLHGQAAPQLLPKARNTAKSPVPSEQRTSRLSEAQQLQAQYLNEAMSREQPPDSASQPAFVWPVPPPLTPPATAAPYPGQQQAMTPQVMEAPAPVYPLPVNPTYQESQVPERGYFGDSDITQGGGVFGGGQTPLIPAQRVPSSRPQVNSDRPSGKPQIGATEAKSLLLQRVARNHKNPNSPTPHHPALLKAEQMVRDRLVSEIQQSVEAERNGRVPPSPPPKDPPSVTSHTTVRPVVISPSTSVRPSARKAVPPSVVPRSQGKAPTASLEHANKAAPVPEATGEINRRHSTIAVDTSERGVRPPSYDTAAASGHRRSATQPAIRLSPSMDAGDRYPIFNNSQTSQRYRNVSVEDISDDSVSTVQDDKPAQQSKPRALSASTGLKQTMTTEKPTAQLPLNTPRSNVGLRAHALSEMSTVTEESTTAANTDRAPPVPPPAPRAPSKSDQPPATPLKSQRTGPPRSRRSSSVAVAAPIVSQVTGVQGSATPLQPQATGLRPQATGLRAQATGLQPQMTGVQSQVNQLQPQATGVQSQVTGIQPQTTGLWPQAPGLRPQFTGLQPQGTGPQPQATGLYPQPTGLQPQATGLQPQATALQPQVTGLQPEVTGLLPQVTGLLPQATVLQPQATGLQPQITGLQPQPTGVMLQPQRTGATGYQLPNPPAQLQQPSSSAFPQPVTPAAAYTTTGTMQSNRPPAVPLPSQTTGLAAPMPSQRPGSILLNPTPAPLAAPQPMAPGLQQPPGSYNQPYPSALPPSQYPGRAAQPQYPDPRPASFMDRTSAAPAPFAAQRTGPPMAPAPSAQFLHPYAVPPGGYPSAPYPTAPIPGSAQWTFPLSQPLQRSATGPERSQFPQQPIQPLQGVRTGPAFPAGPVPARHLRRQSTGAAGNMWNQQQHHRTMSDNPMTRNWDQYPRDQPYRRKESNTLRLFGLDKPRQKSINIVQPDVKRGSEGWAKQMAR